MVCELDFREVWLLFLLKVFFGGGITLRLQILTVVRNSMRSIKSELDFRRVWLLFLLKTFFGGRNNLEIRGSY